MAAPKIRYVTTSDGVSIAFSDVGEGPPVFYLPAGPAHLDLAWEIPEINPVYDSLRQHHRVIRLDPRNTGMSQRGVEDVSLEAAVLDIDAVVARLELTSFAFVGQGLGGSAAIATAAMRPAMVQRLVLANVPVGFPDIPPPPQLQSLLAILPHDWEIFTEVWAGVTYGWRHPLRERSVELIRESIDQRDMVGLLNAPRPVAELLKRVAAPTLVVHQRASSVVPIEQAQRVASEIPDAYLVTLEGTRPGASNDDPRLLSAIDEFLRPDAREQAASPSIAAGLQTILFTDIESSTATTQRLGDHGAQEMIRAHNAIVRESLAARDGREIKHTGDGIMASFGSASSAIDCAMAIQRAASERPDMPRVRIGLNAGEPIVEDGDLFGTTVQLARRICDQAEPAEVYVSDVVRQLAAGKGFLFADAGVAVLKGFDEPVRLYALRWREDG